jgi:hypothetical protein
MTTPNGSLVPEQGGEYGLVMPFVVCQSHGGPYEDGAFVAGYECGWLDMALGVVAKVGGTVERWVRPASLPQLDLIAMHYGYTLVVTNQDDLNQPEWQHVIFRPVGPAADSSEPS